MGYEGECDGVAVSEWGWREECGVVGCVEGFGQVEGCPDLSGGCEGIGVICIAENEGVE